MPSSPRRACATSPPITKRPTRAGRNLFGFPSFRLRHALFHEFPGFELDDVPGGDVGRFLGDRIAADARGGSFHFEYTEIPNLDTPFAGQRFDEHIEHTLHDGLRVVLFELCSFGNNFDDFFFGHALQSPASAIFISCQHIHISIDFMR